MTLTVPQSSTTRPMGWCAGEASGDLIASLILPHVMEKCPDTPMVGVGGPKMTQAGFSPWYSSDELAVRGYVEVIRHLPRLLTLRRTLFERMLASDTKTFVGVDAPDFNLDLALKCRRAGMKAVQVVSPSIWAWRPERITHIGRCVNHVLTIFPFEKALYDKEGIPATYIGHPLASVIPMEPDTVGAREHFGLPPEAPVVCVMPGSRIDELKGCAGVFFETMERLIADMGPMTVLVPAMNEKSREDLLLLSKRFPRLQKYIHVVVGQSHKTIEAADAVLVASGTAALECALFKKPMVVGYRMPMLTGYLMEKKALIRCVSLPNILLNEFAVPECLQYFCSAGVMMPLMKEALTNTAHRARLVERFTEMHHTLLADTGAMAAEVIAHV